MTISGTKLREIRQDLGLSQARLAELSGVSQHLISAFELEKSLLESSLLSKLTKAINDKELVTTVTNRRKRYRNRSETGTTKRENRASLVTQTERNPLYREALSKLYEQHMQPKAAAPKVLSLFSGCGGFSLGFSAAGYDVCGFLELDDKLRKIYKANFPSSLELGGDITDCDSEVIKDFKNKVGNIDVIVGGPPCQGFSLSGKRDVNDPRNALFRHYLRFVDLIKPKVAVLENVRLLASMKNPEGGLVRDDIMEEFSKHGYKIKSFEVNAKTYGVPQSRERIIFIAVRNDLSAEPSIPDAGYAISDDLFSESDPYLTFGDACSDLEYIESGEKGQDPFHAAVNHPSHVIEWLWDVKQGRSAHDNENPDLRPPSGYNTTYKRQIWNEPASTVQTTFGMISGCRNVHPYATRSLTVREAARIQSFPDEYRFLGKLGTIRTGIGNAVPPLLSNKIAKHVKQYL